jgi:hypothetical protein
MDRCFILLFVVLFKSLVNSENNPPVESHGASSSFFFFAVDPGLGLMEGSSGIGGETSVSLVGRKQPLSTSPIDGELERTYFTGQREQPALSPLDAGVSRRTTVCPARSLKLLKSFTSLEIEETNVFQAFSAPGTRFFECSVWSTLASCAPLLAASVVR